MVDCAIEVLPGLAALNVSANELLPLTFCGFNPASPPGCINSMPSCHGNSSTSEYIDYSAIPTPSPPPPASNVDASVHSAYLGIVIGAALVTAASLAGAVVVNSAHTGLQPLQQRGSTATSCREIKFQGIEASVQGIRQGRWPLGAAPKRRLILSGINGSVVCGCASPAHSGHSAGASSTAPRAAAGSSRQ